MNCEPSRVTTEFHAKLIGCDKADRLGRCKEWLDAIVAECPENDSLWRSIFHIVTAQIESGEKIILIAHQRNLNIGDVTGLAGNLAIASEITNSEASIVANKRSPGMSVQGLIVLAIFLLSALSIAGGIVAILWNAMAPTEFTVWKIKLSTGSVGVAFTGIGLVMAYMTFRSVLNNLHAMGAASSRKT